MMEDQKTEAIQQPMKLSDLLVTSALDLDTVFGIEPLFKDLCIKFEPMIQAHCTIIEDKYEKCMSDKSLAETVSSTSLFPDDFITTVAKYLDTKPVALHIKAVAAFHYLGTVSQAMMSWCNSTYYQHLNRIGATGITTGNPEGGKIITGQF